MGMRVLDLFSGIGGFSLGLERAGMKTVAFCEIDPFCRKVLAKHWPGVPIHEDVRELTGHEYSADVICGGYPCQGESLAGERRGAEDDRWLWPEMFRLVKAQRPAWVVGENVAGHITMGLDSVLSDLESESYAVQPFVIPACAVGAKYRRDRVWVIANARGVGWQGRGDGPGKSARTDEPSARRETGRTFQQDAAADPIGWERSQRRSLGRMGGQEQVSRNGAWEITSEPLVCRGTHGIPNRMDRLKALGNAVVPQIPEIIGRAIIQQEAA